MIHLKVSIFWLWIQNILYSIHASPADAADANCKSISKLLACGLSTFSTSGK